MPCDSRHTLQVSSLSSQPVSQWLRSVNVEAWNLSVGALERVRPGIQCLVSANFKTAGLHVVVEAPVAFMC